MKSFFKLIFFIAVIFECAMLARPAAPETRASSTVLVMVGDRGHGSGVYLGKGLVLTAAHVAHDGEVLTVKTNKGGSYVSTVLWKNDKFDLALLKIDTPEDSIVPARLACRTPKVGEEVTSSGNPLSVQFVNTYGRVAGPPTIFADTYVSPISLPILWGMSGGPVFDADGFVLGINDMVLLAPVQGGYGVIGVSATGIGFMVPAKVACLLMGRA